VIHFIEKERLRLFAVGIDELHTVFLHKVAGFEPGKHAESLKVQ